MLGYSYFNKHSFDEKHVVFSLMVWEDCPKLVGFRGECAVLDTAADTPHPAPMEALTGHLGVNPEVGEEWQAHQLRVGRLASRPMALSTCFQLSP